MFTSYPPPVQFAPLRLLGSRTSSNREVPYLLERIRVSNAPRRSKTRGGGLSCAGQQPGRGSTAQVESQQEVRAGPPGLEAEGGVDRPSRKPTGSEGSTAWGGSTAQVESQQAVRARPPGLKAEGGGSTAPVESQQAVRARPPGLEAAGGVDRPSRKPTGSEGSTAWVGSQRGKRSLTAQVERRQRGEDLTT
eukprot:364621-Chlamydomonas_euryale.AAC.6